MYAIIFDLQSIASGFWVCCILYITAYIYCKCKCTHPEICKHAGLQLHLQPIHWMRSNYPKEHSLKASRLYLKCNRTANFFHHRIILSSQPGEETLVVAISIKWRFSNQGKPLLPSASLGKTQFSEIPLNIWRDEDLTQHCDNYQSNSALAQKLVQLIWWRFNINLRQILICPKLMRRRIII